MTSRDIERSSWLREQACKARGAESPSIAQPIVRPPRDALAVPELDDGRFRGINGTSDDEGGVDLTLSVGTVQRQRDCLRTAAAID